MPRKILVLDVVVATATTRVRAVSDTNSPYRYARTAFVRAKKANTGDLYVGDANVSASHYSDVLVGSEKDAYVLGSDFLSDLKEEPKKKNYDLYELYFDAEDSGDGAFVTIEVDIS